MAPMAARTALPVISLTILVRRKKKEKTQMGPIRKTGMAPGRTATRTAMRARGATHSRNRGLIRIEASRSRTTTS